MHDLHKVAEELQMQIERFEKSASLLGLLGAAAATHVAPNLLMKAVKSTKAGHNALTGAFGAGVEMGKQGLNLQHNLRHVFEYGVGPESLVDLEMGRRLGKKLSTIPILKQDRFLDRLHGMAQNRFNSLKPETQGKLHHIPIVNTFTNYMQGNGNQKVKDFLLKHTVPDNQEQSFLSRAGDAAMLGGAYALNHDLLLQPAISFARKQVANSPIGKQILKYNYEKGRRGEQISKIRRGLTDAVVSPAILDPYRIGKAMTDNLRPEVADTIESKVQPVLMNTKM